MTDETTPEDGGLDLPGALKALSKARREVASHKSRFEELSTQLAESYSPERFESELAQARDEMSAQTRTVLAENIALRFNLPDDLADALRGDTREELTAHARRLARYAPYEVEDPDVSGGLDPSGDGERGFDPVAYARSMRRPNNRSA